MTGVQTCALPISGAVGATGPQGPAGTDATFNSSSSYTFGGAGIGVSFATAATFTSGTAYGWNSTFYPYTTGTYNLGNSSYRWATVYATTGTINTSDIREKYNIENSDLGLDFINDLRPVSFKLLVGSTESGIDENGNKVILNTTPGVRNHYGLISQEVKSVLDEHTTRDFAGFILEDKDDPDSAQMLRYTEFIAPMIKAIQELSAQVISLTAEVNDLKSR